MQIKGRLKNFAYKYDKGAGPLSYDDLEKETFVEGNCRLACQYYFYKAYGLFVDPANILLPKAYKEFGSFVFKEETIDVSKLERGDILYAQNFRNKKLEMVNRDRDQFAEEDEWILYFHSAIFLGKLDAELLSLLPEGEYPQNADLVWHSSFIGGGTCVWPLDTFLYHYKLISVKRLSNRGF